MSSETTTHFTAGPGRTVLKEDVNDQGGDLIWSPSGWHNPDGSIRLPLGYEGSVHIDEKGRTKVYYYGKRCW